MPGCGREGPELGEGGCQQELDLSSTDFPAPGFDLLLSEVSFTP